MSIENPKGAHWPIATVSLGIFTPFLWDGSDKMWYNYLGCAKG